VTVPVAFLKPGREKAVRRRHPWIFSGAVERVQGEPAAGATVDVLDSAGRFVARGAYSPASQIRLRAWTFDVRENVDRDFFRRRLVRAVELRRRLGLLGERQACRLVFAEADGLPGLIVDRYAGELVCQFLSAGAEHWRDTIVLLLLELCAPQSIYERSEASARKKEGLASRRGVLHGSPAPDLEVTMGDVRFTVDIAGGQKTGAYLDQQFNRQRVAAYAAGARVLDAFCYNGAFAIASLRQGGAAATLVDSSAEALGLAERQAAANGVAHLCRFEVGNAFETLRALREAGELFDLVILDPPKFVHSAEQLNTGSRGYKDVNMLGLALVRPGGVLATFSCSGHVDRMLFQKIAAGAALDVGRDAQILEVLSQPPDHPIALEFPEAEYLKGLILRVL
jgi:23S rRNA (cytosine1962-C5)-methyltransferase